MNTIKLVISNYLLDEMKETIADSMKEGRTDPTDATYRKIAAGAVHKSGVTIDAEFGDLKELYLRADNQIDTANDNLDGCYNAEDRKTYARMKKAWTAMRDKLAQYLVFERKPVKIGDRVIGHTMIPVELEQFSRGARARA